MRNYLIEKEMTQKISQPVKSSITIPCLMLISRPVLFLFFQLLIALIFNSWQKSEKYWLLTATLTNITCIALLTVLFKREGKNFLSIFSIDRAKFKKDIFVFTGLAIVSLPLVLTPGYFLSILIWDDPDFTTTLMFGPIEKYLVYFLLIAFPVTIAMAELATYFVYVMAKLKEQLRVKWVAVLLPVIFLSIQHCTLPFIPDINFILYRALVFLPFAALIGIAIHLRPSLFVYFAIFHGIMDLGTATMFFLELQ